MKPDRVLQTNLPQPAGPASALSLRAASGEINAPRLRAAQKAVPPRTPAMPARAARHRRWPYPRPALFRSEEHTSELQSHSDLVCRLLLEKKIIISSEKFVL